MQAGEFEPPRQVQADVPAPLDAICRKAMAHRPEDRYGSALELGAEVERWLADEPVRAHREPWAVRLQRRARRRPLLAMWLMLSGAVYLSIAAAGLAVLPLAGVGLPDLGTLLPMMAVVLLCFCALGMSVAGQFGALVGAGAAHVLGRFSRSAATRSTPAGLTVGVVLGYLGTWAVIVSNEAGQPTLREQSLVEKGQRERAAEADPRVKEVLARFPGAKVVEVRRLAAEPPESDAARRALDDEGFVDEDPLSDSDI